MNLFLLHLGCGGNVSPVPKPSLPTCEPWSERLDLHGERVVLCSDQALTLRVEGPSEDLTERWSKQLLKRGFVLEQDVSRPRQVARIYQGETGRLTFMLSESHGETTISFRLKP